MPNRKEHTQKSKVKFVEAVPVSFNIHGFEKVTIDMIMAKAGMTQGEFYKHFTSKEALYSIAVESFLLGRDAVLARSFPDLA